MARFYIIKIESIITTFTISDAGKPTSFVWNLPIPEGLSSGDSILGYLIDPINEFRLLFTVQSVQGTTLTLVKEFETSSGVKSSLGDSDLRTRLASHTCELFEIPETIFKGIFASLTSRFIQDSDKNEEYSGDYSEYIRLLTTNHNLILTGAPGTGKTYLAKQIAATMVGRCKWRDLSKGQKEHVAFVQFHPSFDYTDFVEGLRPDKTGSFVRTNGIFKEFCKTAIEHKSGKWPKKIIKGDTSFETIYRTMVDDIKNQQIVEYPRRDGTTRKIDVGANGRIRYYMAQVKTQSEENIKLLYEYFYNKKIKDVQYESESYYFDLISNLTSKRKRPTKTIDYVEYSWMLQQLLNRAYDSADDGLLVNDYDHPFQDSDVPFVFIIDEINRGELSKIFGELFYSIEPDYRGDETRVKTQYINMIVDKNDPFYEGFYVPTNVYIIGTMNDIDRGVESMDFAIRRRFAWREVTADESAQNMRLSSLATSLMQKLNKAIKEAGLGEEYYIGGAFFRSLKSLTECRDLWDYHLKGVISEYFRGNPKRKDKVAKIEKAFLYDKSDNDELFPPAKDDIKNEETSQDETLTPANEGSE